MKKQRVLVISDGGGSSFHRLILPSQYLQGRVIKIGEEGVELDFKIVSLDIKEKFIREEMMEEGDIIWFNWNIANNITDIGKWRVKKNVKLLYSIDDLWDYSKGNPAYNRLVLQTPKIIHWLVEADIVVASTERLAQHILNYTNKVVYIPNFLPIGEGQFVAKDKIDNGKLNVCLFGSVSHYPDWMSLKNSINRIAKNKELCEKVDFYLCGYVKGDPYWEKVKSLFTVKKHLNLITREAKSVDNYLELLEGIDVCLIPLEDIEYNYCKSALKLAECLAAKVIPIGSRIYESKELGGIGIAETPLEYENWLVYLSNKDNYNKTLQHFEEVNGKDNNFNQRIEDLSKAFEVLINNEFSLKLSNVDIYGIMYGENQWTEYIPYFNKVKTLEEKSYLFEYNPIIDIVSNKLDNKEGYLGVFSHKFPQKTGYFKNLLYKKLHVEKYKEYDYISLSGNWWKNGKEYLEFSEKTHPGLLERLEEVCNIVGLPFTLTPKNVSYSNFYLMKKELYIDFVDNYIKPAIEYMESKPERFMVDSKYLSGLKGEELKAQTELNFYPMHVFILERMIMFYLELKQLKVLNI